MTGYGSQVHYSIWRLSHNGDIQVFLLQSRVVHLQCQTPLQESFVTFFELSLEVVQAQAHLVFQGLLCDISQCMSAYLYRCWKYSHNYCISSTQDLAYVVHACDTQVLLLKWLLSHTWCTQMATPWRRGWLSICNGLFLSDCQILFKFGQNLSPCPHF